MRYKKKRKEYDADLYPFAAIPTEEDRQELNAPFQEDDIKAILNGTLFTRSWSDLSTTWNREHEREDTKNHGRYSNRETRPKKQKSYYEKVEIDKRTKPAKFKAKFGICLDDIIKEIINQGLPPALREK